MDIDRIVRSVGTKSTFFFGSESLLKTIEGDIKKKADFLIALVHFLLTKMYNTLCIGIGDDKTFPVGERGSEMLPDYWNVDESKYALRYVKKNDLYLLLGHITEDTLLINLLHINTMEVSNISVAPELLVNKFSTKIKIAIPTAVELVDRLLQELLVPVMVENSRDAGTQTHKIFTWMPLRSHGRRSYRPRSLGFPFDLDPGGALNMLPNVRNRFGLDLDPAFFPFDFL
ncbi:proteasome inhibitor PI31 subunit-like [Scaptodrosophila lebanonensis]|uniref:Proteasome inhibitor PI31 subunit n=1 Tax=Drosophila lebanonensis TaxID=7225 RepID=A0A6J2T9Z3_DROLE|nr:proteasome inhibitor PI31 subunit-like [Scaptodrosophila lebanonensis]